MAKEIKTAGNWLVLEFDGSPRQVFDGSEPTPKTARRVAGFALREHADLFLNALERPEPVKRSYRLDAISDAASMADYFDDNIVEQLVDDGKASDDINNDYPRGDEYHNESHGNEEYDVQEAAAILEELDEYEETDNGLWEGLEWDKVVSAKAAYTYRNAVASKWSDLIEKINEAYEDISDDINRVEELVDKDELTGDERDELYALNGGNDWTAEEDAKKVAGWFKNWKTAKIKAIVAATITEFKS